MKRLTILSFLVLLALTGCGGGGSSNSDSDGQSSTNAPKGTISGQILDTNGAPLSDVLVSVSDKSTYTDSTGSYVIEKLKYDMSGLITITLTPPDDYLGAVITIAETFSNDSGIELSAFEDGFSLTTGATRLPELNGEVFGRLINNVNGNGIQNTELNLVLEDVFGATDLEGEANLNLEYETFNSTTTTEDDGTFSITNLPVDCYVTLTSQEYVLDNAVKFEPLAESLNIGDVFATPGILNYIELTPNNYTIGLNETINLQVIAVYFDNSEQDITKQATFTLSDTTVATINSNGLLTSKSDGSVTITATFGELFSETTLSVSGALNNNAPIANAGPDQTATTGVQLFLDGTESSDEDGDQLTYSWSIISSPNGASFEISDEHSSSPKFTSNTIGRYELSLIVSDDYANSLEDRVVITIEPDYLNLNQPYITEDGLTVTLQMIDITEKVGSYTYAISYLQENNTTDQVIDETQFHLELESGEILPQYGFFGRLYPGDTRPGFYVFEALKSDAPVALLCYNIFHGSKTNALMWRVELP